LINAQEDERRTIARELHDEVGQVLTAIKVELAVAQRVIDTGGGGARLLDDVRAIADGAITTVRDLSRLLYPPLLDDLGLLAALEWYARGFSKRHGIRVDLVHEGMNDRQLSAETAAAAYRIVQEALTNVAKHAHATTSRVLFEQASNTMRISVTDDGVGFDQSGAGTSGLGLVGIRDRVARLGGSVCVRSSPGKGTTLTVELPTDIRGDVREHDKTVESRQPMTDRVA
jgi:signal transduction histidine kinase